MRAVVQRADSGSVSVNGLIKGRIDKGLVVLLGIKKGDTTDAADYIIDKLVNLRIFEDDQGKMNLSVKDIKGDVLLVSQFTLLGDTRRGRRPSFSEAELSEPALEIFNYCVKAVRAMGINVQTGVFGADMKLKIENDGPCTILLDSEKLF